MSLRKTKSHEVQPHVLISGEVLRQIRQHARSSSKTEVCGVLIGNDDPNGNNKIKVAACIPGLNAAQAGTHVTFTQDTWEHIYRIKDADFPDERIVGWYHSHPGFGVFLSDHDTFIHKNFFSSPLQVAWVYDPHSDEEGCFGWIGSRLERLSEISVEDRKGGEGAGETGKPEPTVMGDREEADPEIEPPELEKETPPWLRTLFLVLTHVVLFGGGFLLAWYLGPRVLLVPVDPHTGQQLGRPIDIRELEALQDKIRAQQGEPAATPQQSPGSPSATTPGPTPGQGSNSPAGRRGSTDPANNTPGQKQPEKSPIQPPDQPKDPHAP